MEQIMCKRKNTTVLGTAVWFLWAVFLAVSVLSAVACLGSVSEETWNVLMERPQFPSCDEHLITQKHKELEMELWETLRDFKENSKATFEDFN